MKRASGFVGCAVLVALAACAAPARPPPVVTPVAPATPPPAPDPRAELAAKIDPIFSAYADARVPGCAVGVYRAGDVVYARGYGYADLEHDAQNSDTTPFYLASVSKQFTAAAVLLLAQDGKLSLDDDVRKYVPELPDYGTPITLAHLLHHTSGVRDYGLLLSLAGTEDTDHVTNDDVLWLLAHQRALNFSPGARYLYSNAGYVLLSQVVQRVSGKPFAAFMKERIFDPLGMSDTLVKDDCTRVIPRRAVGYERRPDKTYAISLSDSEYTGPGNVMSTVRDLAKWDANFYAPKVGGQSFVDGMRVRGKLADGTPITYAMGLDENETHGLAREEHDGAFVGYATEIARYPSERLTVAVLCNDASATPVELATKVAAVFLPQLGEADAKPASAKAIGGAAPFPLAVDPATLAGTYLNRDTFQLRVIEPKEGRLRLRFARSGGGDPRELVPIGPRELVVRDTKTHYSFEPAKGKLAARLVRKSESDPPQTFVRIEPIDNVPPAMLAEYAGRYASDEIARDVEIVVKDGQLLTRTWGRRLDPAPLTPIARDLFTVGGVGCTFERDARGKVTGVVVTDERTTGVRLHRRAP